MTKTLIVPGRDGSDAPHWQDWWAVTVPLPDPARPVPAACKAAPPAHRDDAPSPVMAAVVLLCLAMGGLTSLCIMAAA